MVKGKAFIVDNEGNNGQTHLEESRAERERRLNMANRLGLAMRAGVERS